MPTLPPAALTGLGGRGFGVYVHVPFCAVRCGYCDFNTYTASELAPGVPGASRESYADAALSELDLAVGALGQYPVDTVFFGGGTPTLLDPADLVRIVAGIGSRFGLAPGAEVTTESNPDSVDLAGLEQLRAGGINRISFGMQSARRHVLAVLDRTHDPERLPQVVDWARQAGFEQISLDLIYGTPGETLADWEASVRAALNCRPDHLSAYALVVEDGTALARKVRRHEVPATDDDDLADKYVLADDLLGAAGFDWYEISNWARDPSARCRHNRLYWVSGDWWGIGPGAHSHVGGVRWWNVKHPAEYARRLAAGDDPAAGSEHLDDDTRAVERVLLELRLADGLPLDAVGDPGRVDAVAARGLVQVVDGRLVLTRPGRLLADAVVRDLTP